MHIVKLLDNVDHLIDPDYLKSIFENGRLEGARVFARLFHIFDDGLFEPSSTPFIVNLFPYDIYESEWLLLFGFLRNGFIIDHTKEKISVCYQVTLKLGGIPSFDAYLKPSQLHYNPMLPEEDIRQKYIWHIKHITSSLTSKESVTVPYKNSLLYHYVRTEASLCED
jgi:hypothetical protein